MDRLESLKELKKNHISTLNIHIKKIRLIFHQTNYDV